MFFGGIPLLSDFRRRGVIFIIEGMTIRSL
jgi:hypothetical protein